MHEYGKGGLAKDPSKAAALYEQACDAGNATGCFDLGTMVEAG
jgi:TPR repeat protein